MISRLVIHHRQIYGFGNFYKNKPRKFGGFFLCLIVGIEASAQNIYLLLQYGCLHVISHKYGTHVYEQFQN